MLKVSPQKGVIRLGKQGKLNPRYIGPFKILDRIGPVAYKLELPEELSNVHSMFYVSYLKKCLSDESLVIPMKELQLDDKLNFVEEHVEIGIDFYLWSNSPTITAIMRASRLHHSRHSMGESVDRQFPGKSYAEVRRKPMEFEVGDMFMLKVSPWKGIIRFGKRGKLSPRYIRQFKIIERIGPVAYKLKLPEKLRGIHNMFHFSNLKKYLADEKLVIPLEKIQLDDKLHFIEEPMEIMDREVKQLKRS
nr:putative reverse transcriptase domain-containing protein [Tanacetum cinerariifolium]